MLMLTENAVMVIRDLAAQQGAPQTAGVRITADESAGTFSIDTVTEPAPGDQVVEDLGARAFLDPQAARLLDDMALDAAVVEEGAIEFSVMQRPR
ncbi:MAG TPA: adhesin [Micromonosporaceae bacterium]